MLPGAGLAPGAGLVLEDPPEDSLGAAGSIALGAGIWQETAAREGAHAWLRGWGEGAGDSQQGLNRLAPWSATESAMCDGSGCQHLQEHNLRSCHRASYVFVLGPARYMSHNAMNSTWG